MVGISHVILHLGLCTAMAHAAPETPIAIHVRMIDRVARPQFDQTFTVLRHSSMDKVIEFDAPRGEYQLQLSAPKYGCYGEDYLMFFSEHDRVISENLGVGPPTQLMPLLMDGTAPASFLYLKPTFVLFDKGTVCDKPVGDPLPSNIVVEEDQDAYYVWMYADPSLQAQGPVTVALRIKTATGESHYVRIPMQFPIPWGGWPGNVQFNLSEDEIDSLAGKPIDTLLCPKLFKTTFG